MTRRVGILLRPLCLDAQVHLRRGAQLPNRYAFLKYRETGFPRRIPLHDGHGSKSGAWQIAFPISPSNFGDVRRNLWPDHIEQVRGGSPELASSIFNALGCYGDGASFALRLRNNIRFWRVLGLEFDAGSGRGGESRLVSSASLAQLRTGRGQNAFRFSSVRRYLSSARDAGAFSEICYRRWFVPAMNVFRLSFRLRGSGADSVRFRASLCIWEVGSRLIPQGGGSCVWIGRRG